MFRAARLAAACRPANLNRPPGGAVLYSVDHESAGPPVCGVERPRTLGGGMPARILNWPHRILCLHELHDIGPAFEAFRVWYRVFEAVLCTKEGS